MKNTMNETKYPRWTMRYDHEDFSRSQILAMQLTDADRAAGLPAPEYGYSAERFAEAERIVRAANLYSGVADEDR